jgi:glycolate oxidase iron-sulfur subunit
VIVSGNVGCAVHLAAATGVPVLHTVELLDWAYGGPMPIALQLGDREN